MTMTSPNSWRASLRRLLEQQPVKSRIGIVGIGNTFRCDDAAGILVARALAESRFIRDLETVRVIEAGHAPENVTGDLRRFAAEIVLLIDATEMDESPGTIRWIEMNEIEGMSASTHTMPLSMLAKYLTLELNCKIALLGIQPKSNDMGEIVSSEVLKAVNEIVDGLREALT